MENKINGRKCLIRIIFSVVAWLLMIVEIVVGTRVVDLYYYYYANGRNPIKTIKASIEVQLPRSVEVLEYQYSKDGLYYAKISIAEKDVPTVKEQLLQFFEHEFDYYDVKLRETVMPHFENMCDWWDLQQCDIESAYCKGIVSHGSRGELPRWGKMYKFVSDWAFFAKGQDGTYYLYISAFLSVKLLEDYFY